MSQSIVGELLQETARITLTCRQLMRRAQVRDHQLRGRIVALNLKIDALWGELERLKPNRELASPSNYPP